MFHFLCRIWHFFCEFLMKFCPDFATNSRKESRVSLFQSNLRKQIRKLPKILKSVEIIQYYSILFIRVFNDLVAVLDELAAGRLPLLLLLEELPEHLRLLRLHKIVCMSMTNVNMSYSMLMCLLTVWGYSSTNPSFVLLAEESSVSRGRSLAASSLTAAWRVIDARMEHSSRRTAHLRSQDSEEGPRPRRACVFFWFASVEDLVSTEDAAERRATRRKVLHPKIRSSVTLRHVISTPQRTCPLAI